MGNESTEVGGLKRLLTCSVEGVSSLLIYSLLSFVILHRLSELCTRPFCKWLSVWNATIL